MKLYELTNDFALAIRQVEDADGELPEDLEARLDALQLKIEDKIDQCLAVRQQFTHNSAGVAWEIERLKKLKEQMEAAEERLKKYIMTCLETAGLTKVEGRLFKARIQKNSAPTVAIDEGTKIPPKYERTVFKVEWDKVQLVADWKAGGELPPGVTIKTGAHLRIT